MFKGISKKTEKTEYLNQHCPVSYVICDSQGQTLSQCHEDPKQLINMFLKDILILRKKLVEQMTKDFHQVFDDLNLIITDALQEMEELQKN